MTSTVYRRDLITQVTSWAWKLDPDTEQGPQPDLFDAAGRKFRPEVVYFHRSQVLGDYDERYAVVSGRKVKKNGALTTTGTTYAFHGHDQWPDWLSELCADERRRGDFTLPAVAEQTT